MGKRWTNATDARAMADTLTDAWLKVPARDMAAAARQAGAADDCPECEVCCAIGLCCPLGSEQQRNALALLLLKEGK